MESAENQYWTRLQGGEIVVFDNQRILHARNDFQGHRHYHGGNYSSF